MSLDEEKDFYILMIQNKIDGIETYAEMISKLVQDIHVLLQRREDEKNQLKLPIGENQDG